MILPARVGRPKVEAWSVSGQGWACGHWATDAAAHCKADRRIDLDVSLPWSRLRIQCRDTMHDMVAVMPWFTPTHTGCVGARVGAVVLVLAPVCVSVWIRLDSWMSSRQSCPRFDVRYWARDSAAVMRMFSQDRDRLQE